MHKSRWNVQLLLADTIFFWSAFNLAYRLRIGEWHRDYLITGQSFYVFATLMLCTYILDGYNPQSRLIGLNLGWRYVCAALWSLLVIIFIAYVLGTPFSNQFGRGVMAGAFGCAMVAGALMRFAVLSWLRKSQRAAPWLVLIPADRVEKFERDVKTTLKLNRFSYLVDRVTEAGPQAPVIGVWRDLKKHLENPWAGVVVGWPDAPQPEMVATLFQCRFQGLNVISAEDFYEQSMAKMPVYWLDQRSLMTADGFGFFSSPIGHRIKRVIDIALVLMTAPIALPLLTFGVLLVALSGGGPVFYSQERVGWDRQPFRIRKLRTMRQDAEKAGAQWAQERDPRITAVGHFLRKTRLDELPQLWNILVGDMSFIGPRPERPEFSAKLEDAIPFYGLRYSMRPGLTGWAQVCYRYGASVEDAIEKLEYDLYYIKNYSLLLDAAILIKTVRVVMLGAGR